MNPYTRSFFQGESESSLRAAKRIVPHLVDALSPRSVVDFGCGVGAWLSTFESNGVDDYLGIDGGYIDDDLLLIPRQKFLPRDLNQPIALGRTFDLALCLEVAEHLPSTAAEPLIQSLTASAPAVLFSAAIPNQCGAHHVNEQWQDYWLALFKKAHFAAIDAIRPLIWGDETIDPWYIQNTMLFMKQATIEKFPRLAPYQDSMAGNIVSVVHPRVYLFWSDPKKMTLRKYLRAATALPYALKNSLAPRLMRRTSI